MHDLIKKIHELDKELVDENIFRGGRGFYQVLDETASLEKSNWFFCKSLEDGKRYLMEFASPNMAHVELQKYLRRALFLMVLNHEDGLITARDFSMDPARCFVVLDWVPGKDLKSLLKNFILSLKEALWILLDVARALNHLSQFSFVHRNISPSNIIIEDYTGRVFLSGVEYVAQSNFLQTQLDIDIEYISPELMAYLIAPDKPVFITSWSDIYSLGAVFYHMITGNSPFDKRTDIERRIYKPRIPKIKIPHWTRKDRKFCQNLLNKTMAKKFHKRWYAYQLEDYILSYLEGSDRKEDMARLSQPI